MMRKIISAILALAMCMSLMGGAAALDVSADGKTVTYTFSTNKLNSLNDLAGTNDSTKWFSQSFYDQEKRMSGVSADNFNFGYVCDTAGHGWKFFDAKADDGKSIVMKHRQLSADSTAFRLASSGFDTLTFMRTGVELAPPTEPGFYEVSYYVSDANRLTAYMGTYDGTSPKNVDNYINDAGLLGAASAKKTQTSFGNKVVYSDGSTPLVYAFEQNNTVSVYNVALTRVEDTASINLSNINLDTTKFSTKTAQLKVSVGTEYELTNSFVDYSSDNVNVATVDENGLVTGVATGNANITVKVGGATLKNIPVTVTSEYSDTQYYSFVPKDYNDTTVLTVNGIPNYTEYSTTEYYEDARNWKYHGMAETTKAAYDTATNNAESTGGDIAAAQRGVAGFVTGGLKFVPAKSSDWVSVTLRVPEAGIYKLSFDTAYPDSAYDTSATVSLIPSSVSEEAVRGINSEAKFSGYMLKDKVDFTGTADVEEREVGTFVLCGDDKEVTVAISASSQIRTRGIRLTKISGEVSVSPDTVTVKEGETLTNHITAKMGDATLPRMVGTTYSSDDKDTARVSDKGDITGVKAGTTTLNVKVGDTYTKEINVTVTSAQDPELKTAFTHNERDDSYIYVAPSMTGLTIGGKTINADENADGSYDIEAPETDKDGNKFLYWAKGMETRKKIVSFERKLEGYVPENNGTNFIIAVYEGDIEDTTTPEYYNIDGQLIAKSNEEPDYPSIPGLGTAIAWKDCVGNIKVAEYKDTVRDNVTVTVEGGMGTQQNVPYGTLITCTAESKDTDGKPFKCWKKTLDNGATEIVSIDSTYKFNAWESCTVTAVYEEYTFNGTAMKIIIDSFDVGNDTGVMAEFIGLDNAVEKGIMFTDSNNKTTKIAMTTKDNQFTVVADEPGQYVGYAILKNETAHTFITDGSHEHN